MDEVKGTKRRAKHCKALDKHLGVNIPDLRCYIPIWKSDVDPKKRRLNQKNWVTLPFRGANASERLEKIKQGYSSRWNKAAERVYSGQASSHMRRVTVESCSDICPVEFPPCVQAKIDEIGEGRMEVLKCEHIDDFWIQSGNSKVIGKSLEALFNDRGDQDPDDHGKAFAKKLLEKDAKAQVLDEQVLVCLEYLLRLSQKWSAGSVSKEEIAREPIYNTVTDIFKLCLPLKRARVLYYSHAVNCTAPGVDWVAERHVNNSQDDYWKKRMNYQGWTIDERFYKFIETPGLVGLYEHKVFTKWLEPEECPNPE